MSAWTWIIYRDQVTKIKKIEDMKIKFISIFLLCLTVTGLQAQIDRSKMPKSGPAPEVNLGSPSTFELDNGLKVLVVENDKFPKVRANLLIDNKPYAQEDKVGVKSLFSAMMGNGTDNLDKDSFNENVDNMGASVGYGASSAYASSLTRFFPEAFELMVDGLLNPFFSQDDFKTEKKKMIEGIKSQENSAEAVASDVQPALTYGKNHPYGEFATAESVEALKLKDIKSYYKNFISPKNAYLVIVGDITTKEAKKLVKKHLKKWKKTTPPDAEMPKVKDVQYTQVNLVDMPHAVQSEVAVINTVDLKKTDEDYFPAIVANQILGGGGDARLFNNLREDKSYTYGAYSGLGSDKYISKFTATASVRNEVTDSAVVAFLDEIHKIRDEEVDRQELSLAKAKYTGNFVRALESPSSIADYALAIETDDLPDDFYQTYLEKISAVTKEDIQRVAQKYFKPDNARIVIVGKAKEIAPALEELTYNEKSIPIKYFDKNADPIDNPLKTKEVSDDVSVSSIYEEYIKAIGGKEAVEGINTLYAKYKGAMGPQEIEMTVKETKDGKSLSEIGAQGMTIQKSVFDGENGYVDVQGQKQDFDEDQIEEAKKEAGLFSELEAPKDAEVTGIETVDGEEAYVVKLSDELTSYYSVDSGLKLQSEASAEEGSTTTVYSDYKEVDGVKFPHKLSQSMGPQSIDFEVEEIKVNETFEDSDFE